MLTALDENLCVGGKRIAVILARHLQTCGSADEVEQVLRVVDVGDFDADGEIAAALGLGDGRFGVPFRHEKGLQRRHRAVHSRFEVAVIVGHDVEDGGNAARKVKPEFDGCRIAVVIVDRVRDGE